MTKEEAIEIMYGQVYRKLLHENAEYQAQRHLERMQEDEAEFKKNNPKREDGYGVSRAYESWCRND